MFKKINEGEVESTEGYSIKIMQNRVTYKIEEKVLLIDAEHCLEPYKLVVYATNIDTWCQPFEEEISSKEKTLAIERIDSALDWLNINHSIE